MINLYEKSRLAGIDMKLKSSTNNIKLYYYSFKLCNILDLSNRIFIKIVHLKTKIYKIFKLSIYNLSIFDNDETILTRFKPKLISRSADKYELKLKLRGLRGIR